MRKVLVVLVSLVTLVLGAQGAQASDVGTRGMAEGNVLLLTLPECATEDSDNCVWLAEDRGNGEGRSFYVVDGEVTYLD